jgi:hypothetical protein
MLPGYHNMSWILLNADVTLLITNTVRNVTINKGINKITEHNRQHKKLKTWAAPTPPKNYNNTN